MEREKNKDLEIERIKNWCLLVIDFIATKEDSNLLEIFREGTKLAYQRKDLRGIQTCYRDMTEWVDGFTDQYKSELNEILMTKTGKSLQESKFISTKFIKRIIKQGKINNNIEYDILLRRVDEIYDDNSKKDELVILNHLLLDYDKNKNPSS